MTGGVWADLVGQERVTDVLRQAVRGGRHAMTHAWLVTGPPGSRSGSSDARTASRSRATRSYTGSIAGPS